MIIFVIIYFSWLTKTVFYILTSCSDTLRDSQENVNVVKLSSQFPLRFLLKYAYRKSVIMKNKICNKKLSSGHYQL